MTNDIKLLQIVQDDADTFFREVKDAFSSYVADGYAPTMQYAPVVVGETIVFTAFITAPKEES